MLGAEPKAELASVTRCVAGCLIGHAGADNKSQLLKFDDRVGSRVRQGCGAVKQRSGTRTQYQQALDQGAV